MSNRLPQSLSSLFLVSLLITALFVPAKATSQSQAKQQLSQRLTLTSSILSEQRQVQIVLPENYFSNPTATYPVLYLLDGDYVTAGVSGMLDFLGNKAQVIPDVIVVGIADKGTTRYRQYMTPATSAEQEDKAAKFLNFLTKEVKPFIADQFRTADNHIIAGQSVGGLFVFNALLTQPEAFDHYLAVSPAIWLNDHAIINKAEQVIGKKDLHGASLYLSLGDETRQGVYSVVELVDQRPSPQLNWQFDHYPEENHNSVGIIAIRNNLKAIFDQWSLSDKALEQLGSPEKLVAHYQTLSAKFNIDQAIPTPSVKAMVRYFYRHKKAKQLNEFINETAKILPASEEALIKMQASYVGHFDSPKSALTILQNASPKFTQSVDFLKTLADSYQQNKQADKAQRYYRKALKLARQQDANQWLINIIEAKIAQ